MTFCLFNQLTPTLTPVHYGLLPSSIHGTIPKCAACPPSTSSHFHLLPQNSFSSRIFIKAWTIYLYKWAQYQAYQFAAKASEAARQIPSCEGENLRIRNPQIKRQFWLVSHFFKGIFLRLCNLHQPPLQGEILQCKVGSWCWSKLHSTDPGWKLSGYCPVYSTLLQDWLRVYVSRKWVIYDPSSCNPKGFGRDRLADVAQDIIGLCIQCNHQYPEPSSQRCPQHIWQPSCGSQMDPSKEPH